MPQYIQIDFTKITQEQSDILIARLHEAGFEGFEEIPGKLKAYISSIDFSESILNEIVSAMDVEYSRSVVEDTNWNQVWESNFEPVVVKDFVAIRADFHAPISNVKHEIVITPKMSFGTGHHATTYLVMAQLEMIDLEGKTVFDFGTGTGVLAILAEKLGAAKVVAIDNDSWSIANANENVERNKRNKIQLQLLSAPPVDGKYDLILANINRNVILEHLATLSKQIDSEGCLVLSGLLVEDEDVILAEAGKQGLRLLQKFEKDNWLLLRLRP